MYNIRLTIEYDGTKYCGWQRQGIRGKDFKVMRQKFSIQESIESCLRKILKREVYLVASGRTDSGVHSFGQVANFKTTSEMKPNRIKLALNANLPKDIRISEAKYAPLEFHSRYSVKSKVYQYVILNQDYKSPFFKNYSYWLKHPLDIKLIRKAAVSLLGRHDFKAFCASGSNVKNTTRTIIRVSINNLKIFSCRLVCIEIEADGFLYNMVRNIVGTLIEVGRARFKPGFIKEIVKNKNRSLVGPCVPAKGLYLIKVKY